MIKCYKYCKYYTKYKILWFPIGLFVIGSVSVANADTGLTKKIGELNPRETAEYLGISYWLVNQLVRRREIPCARVGGRVLFRVQALDEYLKEKEEKSLKYQEGR